MQRKIIVVLIILIIALMIIDPSILRINHISVSGVEASSVIGVYWDLSCKERVNQIQWGVLQPGDVTNATVYIRNEWNESFILFSTTTNWTPIIASQYLHLNFSPLNPKLEGGEVVKIILILSVSPNVIGVSEFSFDIVFQARKYLEGDSRLVKEPNVIGVYRDPNCKEQVDQINWTVLPGDVTNATVYIRNEWNESFILFSTTTNWTSKIALNYLNFSCSCPRLEVGEVFETTLTLSVSPDITGVSKFSFDVVFQARKYLGDVNCDGVVNIFDLHMIAVAYQRTPQSDKWNPYLDLNNDRIVNIIDLRIVAKDYGKP